MSEGDASRDVTERLDRLESRVEALGATLEQAVKALQGLNAQQHRLGAEQAQRLDAMEALLAELEFDTLDAHRQSRRIAQLTNVVATRLLRDAQPTIAP